MTLRGGLGAKSILGGKGLYLGRKEQGQELGDSDEQLPADW